MLESFAVYRFIFQAFNLFLLLLGTLAIIIGSVILGVSDPLLEETIPDSYKQPAVLIFIGVSQVILGTFGCLGARIGNTTVLIMYAVTLITLFLIHLFCALSIIFKVDKKEITKGLELAFLDAWDENSSYKELERMFKCCGVNGPGDHDIPPESCYEGNADNENIYEIGCSEALWKWFQKNEVAFLIILILITTTEGICILCALWQARYLNQYYD